MRPRAVPTQQKQQNNEHACFRDGNCACFTLAPAAANNGVPFFETEGRGHREKKVTEGLEGISGELRSHNAGGKGSRQQ